MAQIVTFGTMAARLAIRDVGRAMAIPYTTCDTVAKLVPMELDITIDAALERVSELRDLYESDKQVHELLDMARKIEGMPRHTSTHAAGVVITDRPVVDYVPLSMNDDSPVTQYTMTAIEQLGLLKMDFLGLRNLSVIDHAEQMIAKHTPALKNAPDNDPDVFKMIASGATEGVFQFESAGMRRVIMQSDPKSIEDLIAVISLYRPGPMKFIPMYVENRKHPDKSRTATAPFQNTGCHLRVHHLSGVGWRIFPRACGVFARPRGHCAPRHEQEKARCHGAGARVFRSRLKA